MNSIKDFKQALSAFKPGQFEGFALALFRFQAKYNPVYQQYLNLLGVNIAQVKHIKEIPFLPITFFKEFKVCSGCWDAQTVFESSGTTGKFSKHYIEDLSFYHSVAAGIFESRYGRLKDFHIFALLPSYIEKGNSSLVSMVSNFTGYGHSQYSGFYLSDFEKLISNIKEVQKVQGKIWLIGVTYALLDLAEQYAPDLSDVIVMETGGMKGRRKEMIRPDVHDILSRNLHVKSIHSEYGMTELLSQAYASEGGKFISPPWMKVFIRDLHDPFHIDNGPRPGGINIIDLANIHSCAFIETEDLGRYDIKNQSFEVLGRIDHSDLRGCNLMVD